MTVTDFTASEPVLAITFDGEAWEWFYKLVESLHGLVVVVTPIEGNPYRAIVVGPDWENEEEGDCIFVHRIEEGEPSYIIDHYKSPPESVGVRAVRVL